MSYVSSRASRRAQSFSEVSKAHSNLQDGAHPTFSEDEPEFGFDLEIPDLELALDSDALYLRSEMICASQMTSQRLAEAHQKHLPTEVVVPKYHQGFMDVFSKELLMPSPIGRCGTMP